MMTTAEIVEYYVDLLIMQYRNKPKARKHVAALVEPIIMDQMPLAVQDAFDPLLAEGVQLDILGKYAGVSRTGKGVLRTITLGDDDFRTLIKLVLLKNSSDGTLATVQDLLVANFPGQIYLSDNQTMGLSYVLIESLGTADLLELIVSGNFLPKPMGVQMSVVVLPAIDEPIFGFCTYETPNNDVSFPFNSYEFYQTTNLWLDYEDGV